MQLCWWEYTELRDHLASRPDIWETDGDIWVRRTSSGDPAFVLQFIPPEVSGPYRMYSTHETPVNWTLDDVSEYMEKLVWHWTSYSFRLEMERLLKSELKLEDDVAMMMAIVLQRTQVEPSEDPEKESRAQQALLWEDIPRYEYNRGIAERSLSNLNGSIVLSQHSGQIRVHIRIINPYPANGPHSFYLTGFVRPHGYKSTQFIRFMDIRYQEKIVTDDPDSNLPFPNIILNTHGEEIPSSAFPTREVNLDPPGTSVLDPGLPDGSGSSDHDPSTTREGE